jgi:cellulose synthase/poly-beta-1,6-N-acetylglucosamine synthase-like glycosyltransferase
MEQILNWSYWGLGFFFLFCIAWLVQMYVLLYYFVRIAAAKAKEQHTELKPVSVIIAARNEEKNLMDHIPVIMEQDYPEFEVIVVNDSSWDDTEAILKALSVSYPNLRVINLDEEKQNMQGKKFALTLGIKAAKHETLLFLDADCKPKSNQWIRWMTSPSFRKEETEIVLGFSSYYRHNGWLNKIIRFDTLFVGLHYLGLAKAGKPYMGVGRNLSYTKDVFFRVGGFKSHYSIASGDDDLFINQVAHLRNTVVEFAPEAQTESAPKRTWKEWFAQKRRHFTTAPFYKAQDKNRLALWPISLVALLAGAIGVVVFKTALLVVGSLWLIRYMVAITILHKSTTKLGLAKDIVWLAPLLEWHLLALNLGLYITNLVRKPQKWN